MDDRDAPEHLVGQWMCSEEIHPAVTLLEVAVIERNPPYIRRNLRVRSHQKGNAEIGDPDVCADRADHGCHPDIGLPGCVHHTAAMGGQLLFDGGANEFVLCLLDSNNFEFDPLAGQPAPADIVDGALDRLGDQVLLCRGATGNLAADGAAASQKECADQGSQQISTGHDDPNLSYFTRFQEKAPRAALASAGDIGIG